MASPFGYLLNAQLALRAQMPLAHLATLQPRGGAGTDAPTVFISNCRPDEVETRQLFKECRSILSLRKSASRAKTTLSIAATRSLRAWLHTDPQYSPPLVAKHSLPQSAGAYLALG